MDLKGIAWVGNIYQKFEAMCLEVEEAMYQETTKYVENQVQTVGASMKRFCSDVMQDLLPPSSKDLSRVASADLLLNPYLEFGVHKKPISNIKEDIISPVRVKSVSDNKSNPTNDIWEDWSAATFNWEISDNDEENCDQMVMQASKEANSIAKVGKKLRCNAYSNITRAQRPVSTHPHTDASESSGLSNCQNEDVPRTDSPDNSTCLSLSHPDSHVNASNQCVQSVGDDILHSHTGSLADCDPDLKEDTENDGSLQMVESIGHESESGFEETCVLVDGNDYCSDSHREEIKRSYKKKIQNAFLLKKKSARKQEYKQLAAQYSNNNEESNKITISKNIKPKNLATHDSLESEWELL